jgi:putative tryptophan/tyrosine transport system substrate-binding protein
MASYIGRRKFLATLGGAAAAWSLAARAQQGERFRKIGVLVPAAAGTPHWQAYVAAFREGLQKLGWSDGRNVHIEERWGANADELGSHAAEFVGMTPDVILAGAASASRPMQRATRTIPIVFANVPDPVANGFVTNLARPGGNITGFANYEPTIAVKWLELLKQIAPDVARVAFIYDPTNPTGVAYLREIEAAASSFGAQMSGAAVRDNEEIERAIAAFAREPNGGLVVAGGPSTTSHQAVVIALAARHRLPAVYPVREAVTGGGLASYGVDTSDLFRRAASYVDRILKGEKPSDLPVQFANKFELVINLKTAKALGLDPSIPLLARTDEVIE